MTVYIEKPAVNLREELASLRNQGGYQEQQFYFDSLVTNGTFDTDTNWVKVEFNISGGVAFPNTAGLPNANISQTGLGLVEGDTYILQFDVSGATAVGNLYPRLGSNQNITVINSNTPGGRNGQFSYTVVSLAVDEVKFVVNNGFDGNIDNVSVFTSDGTDVIHAMPKGWVPKDVFEDGLLQREGAANDYEVIYDGFDYVIKPTVAPSITTQTTVIGVRK